MQGIQLTALQQKWAEQKAGTEAAYQEKMPVIEAAKAEVIKAMQGVETGPARAAILDFAHRVVSAGFDVEEYLGRWQQEILSESQRAHDDSGSHGLPHESYPENLGLLLKAFRQIADRCEIRMPYQVAANGLAALCRANPKLSNFAEVVEALEFTPRHSGEFARLDTARKDQLFTEICSRPELLDAFKTDCADRFHSYEARQRLVDGLLEIVCEVYACPRPQLAAYPNRLAKEWASFDQEKWILNFNFSRIPDQAGMEGNETALHALRFCRNILHFHFAGLSPMDEADESQSHCIADSPVDSDTFLIGLYCRALNNAVEAPLLVQSRTYAEQRQMWLPQDSVEFSVRLHERLVKEAGPILILGAPRVGEPRDRRKRASYTVK